VDGDVTITGNATMTSMTGLEALTSVGWSLTIATNSGLTTLSGLEALTTVGERLAITGNVGLESLEGLSGLTSVGMSLEISSNTALPTCLATGLRDGLADLGGGACIQDNLADTCPADPSGC
jgi:hypothetical protein